MYKKFVIIIDMNKDDVIKANRRGSREAEQENSTGFQSVTKAHRNKKKYNRKEHKNYMKNLALLYS